MPADLRQIDADLRRVLGEAYSPPLMLKGILREPILMTNDERELAESLIYAAGAQAWANTRADGCGVYFPAKRPDFRDLAALHAAVLRSERK